jgi:DNA-binding MarR family transcriptional regulator
LTFEARSVLYRTLVELYINLKEAPVPAIATITKELSPAAEHNAPNFIPLARSLGYHLRELSESFTAAVDVKAQAHGISINQWRYLRELLEKDGLSSGELTRRAGRQGPSTVVAVRSLERAGLVRTEGSRSDRRKSHVFLTAKGRRVAAKISPLVQTVQAMAVAGLSAEEIRLLKNLIVRIQRNVDANTRTRNLWAVWRTDLLAREVGA